MTQTKSAPPRPKDTKEAIQLAGKGSVAVSPEQAIEMAATLFGQGKFKQAERVCRQIIEARPTNADAFNILGVTLNALGNPEQAISELRRAVELAPNAAGVHSNLGEVLRQQGQTAEAKTVLERAVQLDPNNSQALNNLGIAHFDLGKPAAAVEFYRRAIAVRPDMAEAHNNLGNALRLVGDIDGAIQAYHNALTHRERYPEAYNNLGTLLQHRGEEDDAEHAFRRAMFQNPGYADAYCNLASLFVGRKNDAEALRILGEALKVAPQHVGTLLQTARIQLRRGAVENAEKLARHALLQEPDNADVLILLGQILHETERVDEALPILERALELRPKSPEALNFYGVALKSVGRLDESREFLLEALKENPNLYGAYANLNDLVDFSKGEGAALFTKLEEIVTSAGAVNAELILPLQYAYAKALDDRGEHERSLEHYIAGGKIKRSQLTYDEGDTHSFFDQIRATFPAAAFENPAYPGVDDARPTFIVGMPRSGSTLVEQILSSHPDVYGAGEVKYLSLAIGRIRDRFPSLPKYPGLMSKVTPAQLDIVAKDYLRMLTASAGNAARVTDKLLTNYFFVGLIHLLFPNAKIIHTRRDPVDTCLSGFTKLFKDDMPHSYDLGELGRYYGKYRELMEHWEDVLPKGTLITVDYEEVVADTEGQAKRLIEFLGLPWNEKCVDFHKSDRPVKTASVAQVRKPIYQTSVKRWKKYGAGLQPLVDAIESKSVTTKDAKADVSENA